MRTCEYIPCSKEFPEQRLAHRYCSEQCKSKNRAYSKRDKARKCAYVSCLNVFEPRHDFHVFCSKLCKHRSRWQKKSIEPGFREKHNGYRRKYYINNVEKVKASIMNSRLKKSYGITLIQKKQRVLNQKHKCANKNCHWSQADFRKFSTDHDHNTGVVRGELCKRCNFVLGLAKDDPSVLDGLAFYLQQYRIVEDLHMTLTKRPR